MISQFIIAGELMILVERRYRGLLPQDEEDSSSGGVNVYEMVALTFLGELSGAIHD